MKLQMLDQYLKVSRFLLEALIIVGCFWVILTPDAASNDVAAFGLLGVITASIVHNLSRKDSD